MVTNLERMVKVWSLLFLGCIIPRQGVGGCYMMIKIEAKSIKLLENVLKIRGYDSTQVWEASGS